LQTQVVAAHQGTRVDRLSYTTHIRNRASLPPGQASTRRADDGGRATASLLASPGAAAPSRSATLMAWHRLSLPAGSGSAEWCNVFTGERLRPPPADAPLSVGTALATVAVGLFVAEATA